MSLAGPVRRIPGHAEDGISTDLQSCLPGFVARSCAHNRGHSRLLDRNDIWIVCVGLIHDRTAAKHHRSEPISSLQAIH